MTGTVLFELEVDKVPVPWSRTRGLQHWKDSRVRGWQAYLRELADEEMALRGREGFPIERPYRIDIMVWYHDRRFEACDQDNCEKCIFDAFNKLVWVDDRLKYMRAHSFEVEWVPVPVERTIITISHKLPRPLKL